VIAIDVTGGGDRARETLAKWLHDDELPGQGEYAGAVGVGQGL